MIARVSLDKAKEQKSQRIGDGFYAVLKQVLEPPAASRPGVVPGVEGSVSGKMSGQAFRLSTLDEAHLYTSRLDEAKTLAPVPSIMPVPTAGAQVRVELAAAIDLYRAMDMPFWLTQAETVLAQTVGVETPAAGETFSQSLPCPPLQSRDRAGRDG